MANHGLVRFDKPQFTDFDSLNRGGVCASDLDNGWIAQLATQSATSGQSELWTATQPVTGALTGLWMAASPEVVITSSGSNSFKGIDSDPQHFYNVAGTLIDFVRLEPGDIVTLTAECLYGNQGTNTYLVATNGSWQLNWSATNPGSCLALLLIGTTYISKGTAGAIGETQQVSAVKCQVVVI